MTHIAITIEPGAWPWIFGVIFLVIVLLTWSSSR